MHLDLHDAAQIHTAVAVLVDLVLDLKLVIAELLIGANVDSAAACLDERAVLGDGRGDLDLDE